MVKIFISYSWDNDEHKKWVRDLAIKLRSDGIDVILDQWDLIPGDQLTSFMERAVRESDYILIICTQKYKERSNNRKGGVGYEGDIMTAEVITTRNERKFLPILKQQPWSESAPSWLLGKYYLDFSTAQNYEKYYEDLKTTVLGIREKAPTLGILRKTQLEPDFVSGNQITNNCYKFEPIRILGVIVDQVGVPRNDGTRGSGLYRIPFRLSIHPPSEWARLFVINWNHPPSFTLMHRPGIASINGDTVILDGTTIEEVKNTHRDTLVLVINKTNKDFGEIIERKQQADEREKEQLKNHKQIVDDIGNQISFNDE